MILSDFTPFEGQHCETTTTGSLLKHIGIELSEPMLFGLGEGLGYIYWNMKIMEFPFIGGRIKPDLLTENIVRNFNLSLETRETSSIKKAWANLHEFIDRGIPVGLKLDSYYLEYFSSKIHFAGHYVAMYGYDETHAYLVDTIQQGGAVTTLLDNLEKARNARGPMSSRNKSFMIQRSGQPTSIHEAIRIAIRNNTKDYLNPPIKNIGYKGILKTASEIKKWFLRSENIEYEFGTTAMLMERGGTGGAIFRNIYRDFLEESAEVLNIKELKGVSDDFGVIAEMWTEVASLFAQVAQTQEEQYVDKASEILVQLSEKEKKAMEKLDRIV